MTDNSNYYQILGIEREATEEDIRKRRRQLAREIHPDRLRAQGAPESQVLAAEEKIKEANRLLDVLEDPNKRAEYDRMLHASDVLSTRDMPTSSQIEGIFVSLFGKAYAQGYDSELRIKETDLEVLFTSTDLALVQALRKIYREPTDTKVFVQKDIKDARVWMPPSIYEIVREGRFVTLYRTIQDWRLPSSRNTPIRLKDGVDSIKNREINKDSRIHEHDLNNQKTPLYDRGCVPAGYPGYLQAIKNIAHQLSLVDEGKLAMSQLSITAELQIINEYNMHSPNGVAVEGRSYSNTKDRELATKIRCTPPYQDLLRRIEAHEVRIMLEGAPKSVEGAKIKPEAQELVPIRLPRNDYGLFAALLRAYKTEYDGKARVWLVAKSPHDDRDWMPTEIYKVVRNEQGVVSILRKVDDFRSESERNSDIPMKDGTSFPKDQFLGEYFFREGRQKLAATSSIPDGYSDYLGRLKKLAEKVAEGKLPTEPEIQAEIQRINEHTHVSTKMRFEGRDATYEVSPGELLESVRRTADGNVREVPKETKIEGNAPSGEMFG